MSRSSKSRPVSCTHVVLAQACCLIGLHLEICQEETRILSQSSPGVSLPCHSLGAGPGLLVLIRLHLEVDQRPGHLQPLLLSPAADETHTEQHFGLRTKAFKILF